MVRGLQAPRAACWTLPHSHILGPELQGLIYAETTGLKVSPSCCHPQGSIHAQSRVSERPGQPGCPSRALPRTQGGGSFRPKPAIVLPKPQGTGSPPPCLSALGALVVLKESEPWAQAAKSLAAGVPSSQVSVHCFCCVLSVTRGSRDKGQGSPTPGFRPPQESSGCKTGVLCTAPPQEHSTAWAKGGFDDWDGVLGPSPCGCD